MPKILAQGQTFEYLRGVMLRKILLQNSIDLYNSGAKVINYRVIDSNSVVVLVETQIKANWSNQGRFSLLPHSPISNLSLVSKI